MLYPSGAIESWPDAQAQGYFLGDWHAAAPGGIWSKGRGIVQFQVSPEQHSRYHTVLLRLAALVGAQGVHYRVRSGGQDQAGSVRGRTEPGVETFEVRVPLEHSPNAVERIELLTQDPVRPMDIGMNRDTRLFGLGLLGLQLIP
jgi:hypothetical protein